MISPETAGHVFLKQADVQTLLRLPTGIFYAQSVKANVLLIRSLPLAQPLGLPVSFFAPSEFRSSTANPSARKRGVRPVWCLKLWIYDLPPSTYYGATGRTNKHFNFKEIR
jgi:type I restriction-modification system DNA methylase subunit